MFRDIQHGSDQPSQAGKPPDDVIITTEDPAVMDDLYWQIAEQRADLMTAVRANMRRESVTEYIREVVDERRIAEVILAAPVMAVLFDGIPTVRSEDHDMTTGLHHPYHFARRPSIILHVFDDFIREQYIEAVFRVGQRLSGGGAQSGQEIGTEIDCLTDSTDLKVEAVHMQTVALPELCGVCPDSAPVIEDYPVVQRDEVGDHLQAAFLSAAPYVARLTPQGGQVAVGYRTVIRFFRLIAHESGVIRSRCDRRSADRHERCAADA